MIPSHALPHRVTVIHPATSTDGYGESTTDYGPAATRVPGVLARLDQSLVNSGESTRNDVAIGLWTMLTNYGHLRAPDRVEYVPPSGELLTLEVVTPPAPVATFVNPAHHYEVQLRSVS